MIHHDQSLFWGSVLPIDSAWGAQFINYIRAQLIHACTLNVCFFGPSLTILLNRLPCARWNLQRAGRTAVLLMCVEPAEVILSLWSDSRNFVTRRDGLVCSSGRHAYRDYGEFLAPGIRKLNFPLKLGQRCDLNAP